MNTIYKYVVLFEKGYYSKKQRTFDWNFTKNLVGALTFNKLRSAEKLKERGIAISEEPVISVRKERWNDIKMGKVKIQKLLRAVQKIM